MIIRTRVRDVYVHNDLVSDDSVLRLTTHPAEITDVDHNIWYTHDGPTVHLAFNRRHDNKSM